MTQVVVSANDVRNVLKKVKTGKQPGPDGIKPEVYKWLSGCCDLSSERCVGKMVEYFEWIIRNGWVPRTERLECVKNCYDSESELSEGEWTETYWVAECWM